MSRPRQWLAVFGDQCVLAAWVLVWVGLSFGPLGDLGGSSARPVMIIVGVAGALVLVLVQSLLVLRRRRTVGMWLAGVTLDPEADLDLEDALLWFVEFWPLTVMLLLSPLIGPRPEQADLVRSSRNRGSGAGRLIVVTMMILSPVPLILAVVG